MGKHTGKTMYKTPTYTSWDSMKNRCNSIKHKSYHRYGGRGISYDEKWESFAGFFEDMGIRPNGHVLDRIDNNLGYFKENCRWTSWSNSNYNKKSTATKSSLPRGVSKTSHRYRSYIRVDKISYHIACFSTPEQAHESYLKMCVEWYGSIPPEEICAM